MQFPEKLNYLLKVYYHIWTAYIVDNGLISMNHIAFTFPLYASHASLYASPSQNSIKST